MKYFICFIVILMMTESVIAQPGNSQCSLYKLGNYNFTTITKMGYNAWLSRPNDSTQVEYFTFGNTEDTTDFHVTWLSDCHYKLTHLHSSHPRFRQLQPGYEIDVEIIKVATDSTVTIKSTLPDRRQEWNTLKKR